MNEVVTLALTKMIHLILGLPNRKLPRRSLDDRIRVRVDARSVFCRRVAAYSAYSTHSIPNTHYGNAVNSCLSTGDIHSGRSSHKWRGVQPFSSWGNYWTNSRMLTYLCANKCQPWIVFENETNYKCGPPWQIGDIDIFVWHREFTEYFSHRAFRSPLMNFFNIVLRKFEWTCCHVL